MISACWFDFIVSRKALIQQLVVAVLMALVVAFSTGSASVVVPVMVCAVVIALPVSLCALDEQGDWQCLRASFPLSRKQVMAGRSLYLALATLAMTVLGSVLAVALSALAPLMPAGLLGNSAGFACEPLDLLLISACSIGIVGVIAGVMLPLLARFGVTRTLTVLPLVFIAVFVGISVIIGSAEFASFAAPLLGVVSDDAVLLAMAVFVGVGVVVFALCSVLAGRVYENRQL